MKQTLVPGKPVEFLTPAEARELIESAWRETVSERVRAPQNILLDGAGAGQDEVYGVPLGFEFEVRRVFLDLSTATDPATGSVLLNAAGKFVQYLRSGNVIEYGQPQYGGAVQVPGVQTWGDEQGPYLRNGEVFEVRAAGLTNGATLRVLVEGILRRPPPERDHGNSGPRSRGGR